MASIAWACWDGGGNLTPSLGIAKELAGRGHDVEFFGRPEMVTRVETAGFPANELQHSRDDLEAFAFHPLSTVFGYTSSPAVGEELVALVAERSPDLVVVDAMFSSALQVSPRYGRPTAVMLHTFFDRLMDMWQMVFAMQSDMRQQAGFEGLADLDTLWGSREVFHVNTLQAFDGEPATTWTNVVHGAPVLASERRAVSVDLPWADDDPTPLVLLSFSTVSEQGSADMLQRALDALGALDVHVVATTGGVVDPGALVAPANTHLVPFADHDALMERASLVVGHGGHGTTMRALSHGLPIVGIPAILSDQVPITETLESWKVGRALPLEADLADIRSAAAEVLAEPVYRREAARRALAFAGLDGAALAADSVESLL